VHHRLSFKDMLKLHLIFVIALATLATEAGAYTSLALVSSHPNKSWSVSAGYLSQNDADNNALEGCRVTSRQSGLDELVTQCKIVGRAAGPGYGAIACGEGGCSWSMGHDLAQSAVNAAYESCIKNYGKCKDKDISHWEDRKGFADMPTAQMALGSGDCRPRTSQRECSSSCKNGSCVVTYQNGCQVRVQVQPQFNALTNLWDYPPPCC